MSPSTSKLEFSSYLTYCPSRRGSGEAIERARDVCYALKQDRVVHARTSAETEPIKERTTYILVRRLAYEVDRGTFATEFAAAGEGTLLVPVPGHAPLKPQALWVADRLAIELASIGWGRRERLLRRVTPVSKSATAAAGERPTTKAHFDSIELAERAHAVNRVVLVDDVVTRGATLLACANRLLERWPQAQVVGFAMFRTISNESEFQQVRAPVERGEIKLLPSGATKRTP